MIVADWVDSLAFVFVFQVYGSVLGAAWPTSEKLSDQRRALMRGLAPLPLYAAGTIDPENKVVVTAEFTPL